MKGKFGLLICAVLLTTIGRAQDTVRLNGQPHWETGLDIADNSFFYEEQPGNATSFQKPYSFEYIKKQVFVPYEKDLRRFRATNRPLVIQWYRFTISNTSSNDTVKLRINVAAHYFTRLYDHERLIERGGAYETFRGEDGNYNPRSNYWIMPIVVPPESTITYWARTEDRLGHLVPPLLILETAYTSAKAIAEGKYKDRYLFLLLAIMTGCLFFITFYAINQYYLYRDTAFLWYIAYGLASLLTGFFWMDIRLGLKMFPAFFHDLMLSVFLFVVPVLYSFFIGDILKLPLHFRRGWMLVKCLIAIAFLQMVVEFVVIRLEWFPINPDYYGLMVSLIPVSLLHIVLLVLTAASREKVKWFLFAGLISLLMFWCSSITFLPLISSSYPELQMILIFPPAFLMMGLTIESVCFSMALSYRSKMILVEKTALQENYTLELQSALQLRAEELTRQNQQLEAQKIKQIEAEFETRIAETEMTALRAQMNPHFIFNCLNSIKLYTLENDSLTASEYLTKFSQLIRLVLENSRSEKVSLQKELETLRLYIELEAMRFKNKVSYRINVVPHIDQQYIEIPPLLLQPYVENAIWHGLMHKPEGGNIAIDIQQPSEYLLHIEITDDGIGRQKSKEHKSKSATRQKSFGLKMTSERLDAINHIYNIKTEVRIVDLVDASGQAAGTSIIIEIPL
jgi:sensor histidine kinase YesM